MPPKKREDQIVQYILRNYKAIFNKLERNDTGHFVGLKQLKDDLLSQLHDALVAIENEIIKQNQQEPPNTSALDSKIESLQAHLDTLSNHPCERLEKQNIAAQIEGHQASILNQDRKTNELKKRLEAEKKLIQKAILTLEDDQRAVALIEGILKIVHGAAAVKKHPGATATPPHPQENKQPRTSSSQLNIRWAAFPVFMLIAAAFITYIYGVFSPSSQDSTPTTNDTNIKAFLRALESSGDPLHIQQAALKIPKLIIAAAAENCVNIVRILLVNRSAINVTERNENTALHYAVLEGNCDDMLELLIQAKPDLNARNDQQQTAITIAASKGHVSCIKKLAAAGANISLADKAGNDALRNAVLNGSEPSVLALIGLGADINEINAVTTTSALHDAASLGHAAIVKLLLASGAKTEDRDNRDVTALYLAVIRNYSEVARLLLEQNADPNCRVGPPQTTPLHAALTTNTAIVELLVKHGAHSNITDNMGQTAMQLANEQGHDLTKLLQP